MTEYVNVTCSKCGKTGKNSYCEPDASQMVERKLCFGCNLWTNRFAGLAGKVGTTIIEGHLYTPGNRTSGSFRGMAGRRFDIEYLHGPLAGQRITTFDLWSGGELPEWLKPQWPDTAKFLNGAERVDLGKGGIYESAFNPSQGKNEPYPLPKTLFTESSNVR